jgi:hypothetical protein
VQKIANTPKNKSICFKIQGYFGNLIVLKKGKTKKAPLPKQIKILLPMIFWTLHCAIKRRKGIHTPHQFYNTKYISWKNPKILLYLAFSLPRTIW